MLSFLIAAFCLGNAQPLLAVDYEWSKVVRGQSATGMRVTGRVVPLNGALFIESAPVQGRVLSILKREGESVTKGSALFAISSAECVSLREEKRVAKNRGLVDLEEGVQKRESQLGLDTSGVECLILATHDGILTKRAVETGAFFNQGDSLATIVAIDRLGVELDVPERNLSSLRIGQEVHFRLASDSGRTLSARIMDIVPTIDQTTRTSKVRLAAVPLPTRTNLDTLVYGVISLGKDEPILKVPTASLVFDHNRQYVLKGSQESPVAVPVRVINESDSMSSVRPFDDGGLVEGDSIVSKGAIFLYSKLKG